MTKRIIHDKDLSVYRIISGNCNVYLIQSAYSNILIDAGNESKFNKLSRAIHKITSTDKIDAILLTHTHYDHTGALANLMDKYKPEIIVQENEKSNLEKGYTPLPEGLNPLFRWIVKLGNKYTPSLAYYAPVKADITFSKQLSLHKYGIEGSIIATPGHTAGSSSIIIENKYCFVGDSLFRIFPWTIKPPFGNDLEALKKSWEKLYNTGCEYFFPAHGLPIRRKKLAKAIRQGL